MSSIKDPNYFRILKKSKKHIYKFADYPGTPKIFSKKNETPYTLNRSIKLKKTYYNTIQKIKIQKIYK